MTVILNNGVIDIPFEITHAQRIIDLQLQKGWDDWKLNDPNFTTTNNVIQYIGDSKKPKKQIQDTGSD